MSAPAPPSLHHAWLMGREHLAAAQVPEPGLEAEVLLRGATGLSRTGLFARWQDAMPPEAWARYQALLVERVLGRPTAYLVGHREFMGLEFAVDERALIPRPETEILVGWVLERLRGLPAPVVADIGTGSGAIAVALAHYHPGVRVIATDLSAAALEVARANARRHGVEGRVTFLAGDLLEPLGAEGFRGGLDALASNPPYVPSRQMDALSGSILKFEPVMAIDGGGDGLRFHRGIIAGAAGLLKPGGGLALEVMAGQADQVAALVGAAGRFTDIRILADFAGIERVVTAAVPV